MDDGPRELFGHRPTDPESVPGSEGEVILAIKPTQRDPSRATVRVGSSRLTAQGTPRRGRVVVTLYRSAIEALGLSVGDAWDEAIAARLEAAGDEDKAFRAAANRLARRAMSAGMITQKLRELGYAEAVRDAVLTRLDKMGLLDDASYGRALIRETTRGKPAGERLLRQKLRAKWLDGTLIERLLAEHREEREQQALQSGDDPNADAIAFARKRAASMARLEPEVRRRRLYGQLARRGFDPDTIRRAMDAALREAEPDLEADFGDVD
ncbi:MAG: regulatory protein RecX [Planctomycetota bacterium]